MTPVPQIPRSIVKQIPKPTATQTPTPSVPTPIPTVIKVQDHVAVVEMIQSNNGAKVVVTDAETNNKTELTQVNGKVQVRKTASVQTIGEARAEIQYGNGSVTRLDHNTSVRMQYNGTSSFDVSVLLDAGRIWSRIKKLTGSEEGTCGGLKECYNSITETMTATVRGTSYGHELKKQEIDGALTKVDSIYTIEGNVWGICNAHRPNDTSIENDYKPQAIRKSKWAIFKCEINKQPVELQDMTSVPKSDSEWISLNMLRDKQLEEQNSEIKYYDKLEAPDPNAPPTVNIESCEIQRYNSIYNPEIEDYELKLVSKTKCDPNEFRTEGGKKIAEVTNMPGIITLVTFNTRVLDEDNLPYGRTVQTR